MLAIDTPNNLMESFKGKKTVVKVKNINDGIIKSIENAGNWLIEFKNNHLYIATSDPDNDNPLIADAIFQAGGKLQSMEVETSNLEEVYLNYVKR